MSHSPTITADTLDVISPLNRERLDTIPAHEPIDLDAAVKTAQDALPIWQSLTLKLRSQIFYTYRSLLLNDIDRLSTLIHQENGKTMTEARAEIEKAIEITEFACSLPQFAIGDVAQVSSGIYCRSELTPLGVVGCITPFNFPSMVPHWTIPIALMLGNAVILKPSEKVPLSALEIAKLLRQAGLPDGIFQVLNGRQEMAQALCEHPDIRAISFVGSTPAAKAVYQRATATGKRALCLGGAKNHLIVLPDADVELTASNIAASMSGCAGQRCMAASVMVGVGDIDPIVTRLVAHAKKIVTGKTMGAVISGDAKTRIETYIANAQADGATLLLDGRNTTSATGENGYYVGPTIIDNVRPDMAIAQAEVFGPVLSIIRVDTVEDALTIENTSAYGNGAGIFTDNGGKAQEIAQRLQSGMIGINIGVPVPREPFGFGGWHASKFGVGDITGKDSISFWTQTKKITSKWKASDAVDWMS